MEPVSRVQLFDKTCFDAAVGLFDRDHLRGGFYHFPKTTEYSIAARGRLRTMTPARTVWSLEYSYILL